MVSDETKKLKNKAKASLTLLLVAVISITTATYAWFSISNSTTVKNMQINVGTGVNLEVATAENGPYDVKLENDAINALLIDQNAKFTKGLEDIRLWPLTSGDGEKLYLQGANSSSSGSATGASTGYYLELPLWFRANADMDVYLNGDDTPNVATGEENGTLITSGRDNTAAQERVDQAVRLSFCPEDGVDFAIYEPNKDGATGLTGKASADSKNGVQDTFVVLGTNAGLTNSGDKTPVLFTLRKDVPKQVVLRVWMEGQDPECVNDGSNGGINLEKAQLDIRLRLCGADENGNYMEGATA